MDIWKFHSRLLLFLLLGLTNLFTMAQMVQEVSESYTDTVATPNYEPVFVTSMVDYINDAPNWSQVDTSFLLFSDFDQAYNQTFYSATLGNIGQSNRVLDYQFEPFGFRLKKIPLPNYLYTVQNLPFFRTKSPYSRVFYVMGSNKHHLLNGVHAQQIKNFSLGTSFNVINSLGAYQQQRSSVASASAYLTYQNGKENYRALFSYFFNQLTLSENGGLLNDSLFIFNIEPFRGGMPISLRKARNEFVQNHFEFTQTYAPFFRKDSLISNKNQWFIFAHSAKYDKQKWIFWQDELDSIQSLSASFNPLFTKDSLASHSLENRLEWQTKLKIPLMGMNVLFNSAFGINYTLFSAGDSVSNTSQDFYGIHARANLGIDSLWRLAYQSEQVIGGWNSGAYSYNMSFAMLLSKKHELKLDVLFRSIPQTFFTNSFNGNFFQWSNRFSRLNEKKIGVFYSFFPISIGIDAFQISNHVYLNEQLMPEIFSDNIELFRFWSEINLSYQFLRSQTRLTYHQNSASEIMMFPDYVARQKVYAVFHMFKNAMLTSAGIEGAYVSEYNGAFYNPNLFDFYLNKTERIGNFFYFDVFISFKVKRFNLMVKMINAPQGLLSYDYFSTPNYPLPDRQFRLGVSWRFYD